MEEIKRWY